MPTITEERRQQIDEIEEKIRDEMKEIDEKKDVLEGIKDLMENVTNDQMDQMSANASSSARRRGQTDPIDLEERLRHYGDEISRLEEEIQEKEGELERLRWEKHDLESFEHGV